MSAIEQAIHRLDPDYQITPRQHLAIDQADDPVAVAEALPEQIENNRVSIARGVGVDVAHVTNGDGLSAAHLHSAVTAQRSSDPMHVARKMSPDRLVAIGRRVESAQEPDALYANYFKLLGRAPDPEGLAFYRGKYEGGTRLSVIIADIEDSDEAQA